jgi:serine/threonine/tyrosine-interacting protein
MFVMEHHQMGYEDALHMVQNRRYCISPNGGFLTQIKVRTMISMYMMRNEVFLARANLQFCHSQEYESIYRASIAVAAFPQSNREQNTRRKRDDDDDDDEVQRYGSNFLLDNSYCLYITASRMEERKRPNFKDPNPQAPVQEDTEMIMS